MTGIKDTLGDKLYYPQAPGHRGVDTSIEAANMIAPHTNRLHNLIANYLAGRTGGALYTEIMKDLDLSSGTVCGRLREMRLMVPPLVKVTDVRRKTPSGASAKVYFATEAAIQQSKRSA